MDSGRVEYDNAASLTASHLILSQSDKRSHITFFSSPNDTITLTNDGPAVIGNGITLLPGAPPLYLCTHFHGYAVQGEWYAIYSSGLKPLSWIQAMESEPYQTEGR